MAKLRSNLLHELTRPDVEEWLKTEPVPVAIIALGSCEQHGPHLPLGMDSLHAAAFAKAVAERTNSVAVAPCLPGYSPHHMGFPGTLTFRDTTLRDILYDVCESLGRHGVKRQVIVNGHGGNREIIAYAARMASRAYGIRVAATPGPRATGDPEPGLRDFLRRMDVHSGEGETSIALHLFPELVRMDRVARWEPTMKLPPEVEALLDPEMAEFDLAGQLVRHYTQNTHEFTSSGVYGWARPQDADPEKGARDFEKRVAWLARYIEVWKTLP